LATWIWSKNGNTLKHGQHADSNYKLAGHLCSQVVAMGKILGKFKRARFLPEAKCFGILLALFKWASMAAIMSVFSE